MMVYGIDRAAFNQGVNAKYEFIISEDYATTLVSRGPSAVGIIDDLSENSRCAVFDGLQVGTAATGYAGQISPAREREREREMGADETYQQTTGPLMANSHPGSYSGQDAYTDMFITGNSVVRRLTPLECERLQGFPDNWTDIGAWTDSKGKMHKESSDSARYRALGNSISTGPNSFWEFLLKRIAGQYSRRITMGSLFDGIGGFPLIHEQINGKGSCRWASEIEEFCIAVTKYHFGED